MVSYKKPLEKFFALDFANDYLQKTISKGSYAKNLIYLISPITFTHTDYPSHRKTSKFKNNPKI
jgi:hypothetical protein